MPTENERDPRAILVREKHFTLRPKPLERWLWEQGLPQAAERVFWMHWQEGMLRGDWCSEISLKEVARACCVDPSTVTRAYQLLKSLGLVRREDAGRDPHNPFQQAVAITEVRVPRELLVLLSRSPNRSARAIAETSVPLVDSPAPKEECTPKLPSAPPRFARHEVRTLMEKLSDQERREFHEASRERRCDMAFDAGSVLDAAERGRVLELLAQISGERPKPQETPSRPAAPAAYARIRRFSPLESARLRKRLTLLVPASATAEAFRQVLWSIEEGALRRFDPNLAVNIALKKIREGTWTRPNRMPPNWLRGAAPETCSAA